jgi:hypothetical protein
MSCSLGPTTCSDVLHIMAAVPQCMCALRIVCMCVAFDLDRGELWCGVVCGQ